VRKLALALVGPAVVAVGFATPAGLAEEKVGPGSPATSRELLDCTGAPDRTCNETGGGVVPDSGTVAVYGCSPLEYGGCGESVYEICVGDETELTVEMTYDHVTGVNDLDLFLLDGCDEERCLDHSTMISGFERVIATVPAGNYFAVVDGWTPVGSDGRCDGSGHTILVLCDTACSTVAVDPESWGEIKARYRE
jgi:hypothetical protein